LKAHLTAHFADRERMSISRSASHLTFSPPGPDAPFTVTDESGIVGSSTAMKRLRQQVRRIGPHFRTVLVSGEAGTGKELVARALHRMSPAADGPFIVCHADAVKDALAECGGSDRTADHVGRLMKRSARGTLFLDQLSDMPLEMQGRLLRVLTQYELTQSRGNESQRIDLRIIASTEEDLRILVSTGRFSHELYQRLATVDITLPPLRERMEDLPELARCFLERFATLYGRGVREIADEAIERMQKHRWPGNVRELESLLRNSVLRSEGEVLELHALPLFAETSEPEQLTTGTSVSIRLHDVVEQHVLRVLKNCGGNKLRASEMLGISRSTLYRMLDAGVSADTLR
jgi:DNA-binding NtrC family response regulator